MLGDFGTAVDVVSLDRFFSERKLMRLDFVKIDVEGMEYQVLAGGAATWAVHQPVLYFESEASGDPARALPVFERIEALLRGLGYALYRVERDWTLRAVAARNMPGYTLAAPVSHPDLRDGIRLPGTPPRRVLP